MRPSVIPLLLPVPAPESSTGEHRVSTKDPPAPATPLQAFSSCAPPPPPPPLRPFPPELPPRPPPSLPPHVQALSTVRKGPAGVPAHGERAPHIADQNADPEAAQHDFAAEKRVGGLSDPAGVGPDMALARSPRAAHFVASSPSAPAFLRPKAPPPPPVRPAQAPTLTGPVPRRCAALQMFYKHMDVPHVDDYCAAKVIPHIESPSIINDVLKEYSARSLEDRDASIYALVESTSPQNDKAAMILLELTTYGYVCFGRGGGGVRGSVGRRVVDNLNVGVLSEMHCTTRRGVVQGVGARRVGSVRRVVQCRTRRRGPTRRGCTTRRTVSYKVSYSTNTVRHSTT